MNAHRIAAIVLVVLTAQVAVTPAAQVAASRGDEPPAPPLLTARVVSARLGAVSAGEFDVEFIIGLTASRAVVLRRVEFKENFAGDVPIVIEQIRGRWRLEPGRELVLDVPVRIRLQVEDLRRFADVVALFSRDTVTIRTLVAVTFDPPLLSRLFLLQRARVALSATTLEVSGKELLANSGGLAGAGVDVASLASKVVLPLLERLRALVPQQQEWLERLSTSAARVTTTYAVVDPQGQRTSRTVTSVAFWWNTATLCTTREALEPWRFDITHAALVARGGNVDAGSAAHEIAARQRRWRLDSSALLAGLLPVEAKTALIVDGAEVRRGRLLDREESSNVACLRGIDGVPLDSAGDTSRDPFPAAAAYPDGAAFDVVRTNVTGGDGDQLLLSAPIGKESYGSPLLTAGGRAGGMIIAPGRALRASRLARAAAAAVPVRAVP